MEDSDVLLWKISGLALSREGCEFAIHKLVASFIVDMGRLGRVALEGRQIGPSLCVGQP